MREIGVQKHPSIFPFHGTRNHMPLIKIEALWLHASELRRDPILVNKND